MLGTTLLIAGSLILGQGDRQSSYNYMEDLEMLIGTSVGNFELPGGRPDIGDAGAKIERRVTARWALNKSIVIFRMSRLVDGKLTVKWMEVAYWNPEQKRIEHSILVPGGSSSTGVWSKEGDELILKWSVVLPEGVKYAGTSRMRSTGADTYDWTIKECIRNGESIPDLPVVKFTPGEEE